MRGAKLFLEAAHRHGITKVFGIVGGEAQAMRFDEVPGLDFYLTRHEFAAGIMADVYARLVGHPQMCYSTFGPGLTNLTTGVCSARLDRSPMLAVSAQVPRNERVFNETHQCVDNAAVMRPMAKFSHELDSVEEIPAIVTEAMTHARREVPGPSFISFPLDLMKAEIPDEQAEQLLGKMGSSEPSAAPDAKADELRWIAEQLKNAKHPMVLVGNLVFRENAVSELRAFVERWQLPVGTTLASKGALSDDHPLHIGAFNKYLDGILHWQALDTVFGNCDLMLLIGYDFGEDVKPNQWMRNPTIRNISLTPNANPMGSVFSSEREVIGRLKTSLAMLAELAPPNRTAELGAVKELKQRKFKAGDAPIQEYPTIPVPAIVKIVRKVVGPTGVLCSDIGLHKQYAGLFSEAYEPNTFMCSNGCGTFGFGLPAALGAQLARPNERVAVICGDGGFHSTSHDLETAVRYNIPVVIVLLKDNAFGLIKYYQLLDKPDIFGGSVNFGDVNFGRLAEANGMPGHFVTGRAQLEEVLEQAFRQRKPALLELPIRYQYRFAAPT